MSDFIYNWIKQIITIFFVLSIVELILPKGSIKRYVDFIMGLLVVLVFINPFIKLGDINLDLDRQVFNYNLDELDARDYEYLNDRQEELIEKLYLEKISNEVIRLIEENGQYIVEKVIPSIVKYEESYGEIDYLDIVVIDSIESSMENRIKIQKIEIQKEIDKKDNNTSNEFKEIRKLISDNLDISEELIYISLKDEELK